MQQPTGLSNQGDTFFSLKDITYTPETPKMNEPFLVRGKIELFGIPFLAPIWVIVTCVYPETWWEEIIPIIGAPQVRESDMIIGGNFEVKFDKGFQREGEFKLIVGVYAGPTMLIDNWTLPPFPAVGSKETTFIVEGEVTPPEEVWELVEEVLGIVVEPGPEVEVWQLVEEVLGIILEPAPPVTAWELVEEIVGIIVRPLGVPVEYSIILRVDPTGAGTITKEPSKIKYAMGEIVKLTAHPAAGYEFSYWDVDGGWLSDANPINYVVMRDRTVTAHFY